MDLLDSADKGSTRSIPPESPSSPPDSCCASNFSMPMMYCSLRAKSLVHTCKQGLQSGPCQGPVKQSHDEELAQHKYYLSITWSRGAWLATSLVFNYHHLPLAEPFVSVPSRDFFGISEKKMGLIYRTGQPTKRRFFFWLSKLKLHVTGNEAPACPH